MGKFRRDITKSDMETEIIDEIINNLCDRSGFDDWWWNIGEDIQDEIKEEMLNIIKSKKYLESKK
jgi:signal recognition particle GTPase